MQESAKFDLLELLVRRQNISLVPAKFGGTDTPRFAVKPTEAHDRADTHAELLGNFRNRGAILRRPNYAFPQILRIRLPHSMLAALPVRTLNPIRALKGIPPDSVIPGTALSAKSSTGHILTFCRQR